MKEISSPTIGAISEALSKAQAFIGNAIKDSKNPFFKTTYADLAAVRNACQKPLSENGLAITGSVVFEEGMWIYVGTLSHKQSGEWFRTYIPLLMAKNDMQSFGSAQTYAERYALKSLVGVATEDDDGEASIDRNAAAPVKKTTHVESNEEFLNADEYMEVVGLIAQLDLKGEAYKKFLSFAEAPSIEKIRRKDYEKVIKQLQMKIAKEIHNA